VGKKIGIFKRFFVFRSNSYIFVSEISQFLLAKDIIYRKMPKICKNLAFFSLKALKTRSFCNFLLFKTLNGQK
jgi:hypothetical protein